MCGIAGIVYKEKNRSVLHRDISAMCQAMVHRGPDDEGIFVHENVGLGHRRLKIIDLEGGHQPMTNEDETCWLTFNGEIYNYVELRKMLEEKGHRFKSRSDTEVVLHLYEEYGANCLEKLNGMFAFALVDLKREELFAARDRFGIKPFYFYVDNQQFVFASEIKSILEASGVKTSPNYSEVFSYFVFQFPLKTETFFRQIFQLPPAHLLKLSLKEGKDPSVVRYWDLCFDNIDFRDEKYFEEQLRFVLDDAVRLQLRSDVPVGSHLSGGVDSTIVATLARKHSKGSFKTFTGAFDEGPEYDETPYAQAVANHIQAEYYEVFPTSRHFVDSLPKLVTFMDEPAAGPGLFPQYCVSQLAANHVKVVLGGQGGDEIFGGYARYLVAYLEECLKGAILGTHQGDDKKFVVHWDDILPNLSLLRDYTPMLKHFWEKGLFEDRTFRYFRLIDRADDIANVFSEDVHFSVVHQKAFELFKDRFDSLSDRSLINKMIHFDMQTLLPALLHVEDRVSMACSLESRVPLLDHRIAELMARVPPKLKFSGGRQKNLLRYAVDELVCPIVLDRKDKKGFPVPLSEWFNGPLRGYVREVLLGQRARERGLFSSAGLEKLLGSERKFGRHVWGLLNVELWFQQFECKFT